MLLPYIKHGIDILYHSDSGVMIPPEINVITMGDSPRIRAYVFAGYGQFAKDLLWGHKAATTSGALTDLLKLTEQLVAGHVGPSIKSKLARLAAQTTDTNSVKPDDNAFKVGATSIKADTTSVKAETASVKPDTTPVEAEATSVKHQTTPIKRENTPMKREVTPIKREVIPIKREFTPIKREITPIKSTITPVKPTHLRNESGVKMYWGTDEINNTSFVGDFNRRLRSDSGFDSADGENHPNRSFHNLAPMAGGRGDLFW